MVHGPQQVSAVVSSGSNDSGSRGHARGQPRRTRSCLRTAVHLIRRGRWRVYPRGRARWDKLTDVRAQRAEPTGSVAVTTVDLHRRFLEALGPKAQLSASVHLSERPLEVTCVPPLPSRMRVYLYRLTTHAAERQAGAFRIQIMLPGQSRRGGRAHLDYSDDHVAVLAGYHEGLDVFALWDAGLIDGPDGIPFSRGCQVLDETLYRALVEGVAEQQRQLRQRGDGRRRPVIAPRRRARAAVAPDGGATGTAGDAAVTDLERGGWGERGGRLTRSTAATSTT